VEWRVSWGVGQGQNWGCSAKGGKKIPDTHASICEREKCERSLPFCLKLPVKVFTDDLNLNDDNDENNNTTLIMISN
jgi:hypothetical protein